MDVSFDGPAAAANALNDRVDVVWVAKRGNATAFTVHSGISLMFMIGPTATDPGLPDGTPRPDPIAQFGRLDIS
jgi:hypothetical protein